ncbi:hypothetical protein GGI24_004037, partial [Coemansia furcata]
MLMYRLIQKLRELGGELTSLVPLFHMAASYITFDTRGIYHLLRNLAAKYPGLIECPETSENRFVQNRLEHLPAVLNLPPKLVQRPGEDVVGNRAYFRHSFSTDGVGVSLSTRQWKSRPNAAKNPESDEKKAKRLADAAAESVAPGKASTNYDREIVAIDPGRQAIITAIRMCDPNWTYSLSADEYYRMCGYDDDKAKDDKEISNMDGLHDWMTRMPTYKTANAKETLARLRYMFHSDYFRQYIDIQLDIRKRIRRWETYKRQQRVIVEVCRRLTQGLNKTKTIIFVGDATFNTSSRGYIPGPNMSAFIEHLRRTGWTVITVWEFNTSQVCSYCCRQFHDDEMPYKMCD